MSPSTASRTQNGSLKLAGAYVHGDIYKGLVKLATAGNHSLAAQCRHIFDQALLEALIERACDPRVGDRIIAQNGTTVIEIKAVFPIGPGNETCVEYTDGQGEYIPTLLWKYRGLAATAIRESHTFHAVEDDEE